MEAFILTVGTTVVIQAILALGLNLQWGLAGLLNLSYIVLVALGAYITAVVTLPPAIAPITYVFGFQLPFVVGVAAALLICGLAGGLIAAVSMRRLRGDYLAIFTLVLATMAIQFVSAYQPLFDGDTGVYGVPPPFAGMLNLAQGTNSYSWVYLGFCVLMLAFAFLCAERIRRSPFGRALRATRDDDQAVLALGKDVYALKVKAFVAGGALAGLGGALIMGYATAFGPSAWTIGESVVVLTCVIVGGTANNLGAVVGTLLIVGVVQGVTQLVPVSPAHPYVVPTLRFIFVAVVTLATLYWRPQGLIPERLDVDRGRGLQDASPRS